MSGIPMRYISTRGAEDQTPILFSEALLKGLAPDGGLYIPTHFPILNLLDASWQTMTYQERCFKILKPFMPEINAQDLRLAIDKAYDDKFTSPQIAPLAYLDDHTAVLELFRGSTQAFKDMALSLLPHLMNLSARATASTIKERYVLTATSGDTGKAALEAFKDIEGIQVIVFYPTSGVSDMQKCQMVTQVGNNVHVFGIDGNFDDAQRAVKALMSDATLAEEMLKRQQCFASANSVNIGRLVSQIVYYISGYHDLVKAGRIALGASIHVVVPTGNFGNILAAYYAKVMGLPIDRLIMASNENRVLDDFMKTGVYNANRDFYVTDAPSMDILVSSNLERYLCHQMQLDDQNLGTVSERIREMMTRLSQSGSFELTFEHEDMVSGWADKDQVREMIKKYYQDCGYVLDPHTAVGLAVLNAYRESTQDNQYAIVAGTASPFKFPLSVLKALDASQASGIAEQLTLVSKLWGEPVPKALEDALTMPIRHTRVIDKSEMIAEVKKIIGGGGQ